MRCRLLFPVIWLLVFPAHGEPRTFTDASGRTLLAELEAVEVDTITIRRQDGKVFTLPLKSLAESDQAYARKWQANRATADDVEQEKEKAIQESAARREAIAEFCRRHHRQQVGNGECWTLADDAFLASGATRPGEDPRVWGREIDFSKEPIEPGDIVEFRTAEIPGYGITGPEHTAVVIKGGRRGKCTLAEQNWSGVKTVREITVNLSGLLSGRVMVYRPQ